MVWHIENLAIIMSLKNKIEKYEKRRDTSTIFPV